MTPRISSRRQPMDAPEVRIRLKDAQTRLVSAELEAVIYASAAGHSNAMKPLLQKSDFASIVAVLVAMGLYKDTGRSGAYGWGLKGRFWRACGRGIPRKSGGTNHPIAIPRTLAK